MLYNKYYITLIILLSISRICVSFPIFISSIYSSYVDNINNYKIDIEKVYTDNREIFIEKIFWITIDKLLNIDKKLYLTKEIGIEFFYDNQNS